MPSPIDQVSEVPKSVVLEQCIEWVDNPSALRAAF
jgi:hypothetical protein